MKVWMVRAGRFGAHELFALENGYAVIGWYEMPDLSQADTGEKMQALILVE